MSVRYHIISLASVFLALAVGIVVGSTSVSQQLLSMVAGDRHSLTEQVRQLNTQRAELEARERSANAFDAVVGPAVVRGQLEQRRVILLLAPDADPVDRDAVRQLITQAGGTVTGELALTEAVIDPSKAEAVRDLTTRLLPAGAQLPTTADAGGLVGGLLGSTLLLRAPDGQPQASADQAGAALAGLMQAGFVHAGPHPAPAQLAVVLTGGGLTASFSAERAATLARLCTELRRYASGAVLAGRSGAEGPAGAVGVIRADTVASTALSTVDGLQTPVGRVAVVLALREQADGRAGRYGSASNAQAPIPGASVG
ncbi:MAG: copper transporter [Pseudonocardia sp.]|nr:copper transporter [Pseudonocardia sp.]